MKTIHEDTNNKQFTAVQYKPIKDIAVCYPGATPKTSKPEYWENGTIPWMSSGEVNKGEIYETDQKITQLGYDSTSTKMVPPNSVVIALAGQGKTRGTVAITRIELCTNQSLCAIVPGAEILAEYLLHYLKSKYADLRHISSKNGERGGLNVQMIKEYIVPVPPLEVQEKIVHILDDYAKKNNALIDAIYSELKERKKQLYYYRSRLFSFDNSVPKSALSKIASFKYGYTDKAKDEGKIRFIRITDINEEGLLKVDNAKYIDETNETTEYHLSYGDLVMARTGATFGKTLFFDGNEPSVFASFLIKICFDSNQILNRYYWHFTKTPQYWQQANEYVSKAGQQQFNTGAIGKVVIPIPSINEQERIVGILDALEEKVIQLCENLSKEKEMRLEQYTYYRDAILSFPKKSNCEGTHS